MLKINTTILLFIIIIIHSAFIFPQDLIINSEVTFQDTTIILNGNLIIKDGGGLEMDSSTIVINSQYNGEHGIRVEKSGDYLSMNNSEIKTSVGSNPIYFVCKGEKFEMKNSKLSNIGWGDIDEINENDFINGEKGPLITSSNALIENSEFKDCNTAIIITSDSASVKNCEINSVVAHGILLWNVKHSLIENNTIQSDESSGLITIHSGSNNNILNNTLVSPYIEGATHGVRMLQSSDNNISGNYIDSYGIGVLMLGPGDNNTILNNTIKSGEMAIQVWGWNNQVLNNTLYPFNEWAGDLITLVNAYNSEIRNNRIIGLLNSGGSGIWLRHSSNNLINDNDIQVLPSSHYTNKTKGIFITESSSNNVVVGNQIDGSVFGLVVSYSSNNNKLYNNSISNIDYQGIILDESEGNIVYSNNDFNNVGKQKYDNGNNTWNYNGSEPTINYVEKPNFESIYEETISEPTVIENQTINFHYAVILEGASLTLRNVTVITGVDHTDISYFDISPNASLEIYDCDIILDQYGSGFTIDAGSESNYVLKNTSISGAGHEWWYRGIFIMTNDFIIEDCTFNNCTISFLGCDGGTFSNNRIQNTFTSILFQDEPRNMTISDNIIDGSMAAAITGGCRNVTIANNQIKNIWSNGIEPMGFIDCSVENNHISNIFEPFTAISEGHTAINNKIEKAHIGIYDKAESRGNNISIMNNQISQCNIGFLTNADSESNLNNMITNCGIGLYLDGSGNNLSGFVITECDTGIYLSEDASNNSIYGNDLINNTTQVISQATTSNSWDKSGSGNYWSDYQGVDNNNDGIGDTPYSIAQSMTDNYPLMQPNSDPFEIVSIDVEAHDLAPNFYGAGLTNIPICKISLSVANEDNGRTAQLVGMDMNKSGTGLDSDIASIKYWLDSDQNSVFNSINDSLIGKGIFKNGKSKLSFNDNVAITSSNTVIFSTIDISDSISDTSNTIGFSISDSSYFKFDFPNVVRNNAFPIILSQATLPISEETFATLKFELGNNIPNPFNPITTIRYSIPQESKVVIKVFNLLGKEVVTLVNETQEYGHYAVNWNGVDKNGLQVSNGIYFYQLWSGDFVKTKKMLFLK